jgi:phosphate butyryltransferase
MFKNFKAISIENKSKKTLVVAAAHDVHTLEAVYEAADEMGIEYILIGRKAEILHLSSIMGKTPANVINCNDDAETARLAVRTVRGLDGAVLMKGLIETPALLSAVLNKEEGIRESATLSHAAILEIPKYHKLVTITDGGMCAYPTLPQKADIIKNTLDFYAGFGITGIKVAVLSASETVNEKIPESTDAVELVKMHQNGEFGGCILEGPLSFDLAVSREAAEVKGFKSRVSGDVDVLLVPNVTAGNILCKGLIYWGGAKMAGAVLGAKCPIVLVSRGASAEEKRLSIMMGIT